MISTATLYYIPNHQFANRQYFIGTKTSYVIGTVTGVKNTGNNMQKIQLPSNALFAKFNLIEMDGKFYDIVSFENSTFKDGSSKLDIMFNPVVTYFSSGMSVSGFFSNTPTKQSLGVKIPVGNDMFKTARTVTLPKLPDYVSGSNTYPSVFYQLTSKYDLASTKPTSGLYSYVGMCPWQNWFMSFELASGYEIMPSATDQYVPLFKMMDDLDLVAGIPSDSIVDISLSRRCPWKTQISGFRYSIVDGANNPCEPILFSANNWGLIKIDTSEAQFTADAGTSYNLTLTDYERFCGKVYVIDDIGNIAGELPTELFDASNTLAYKCFAVPDYGQLVTHFTFLDRTIILQEGRLPWVGDGWQDYQIRVMSYDRQELNNNLTQIRRQQDIDMLNAVSNGMLTSAVGMTGGNPAGAVMGIAQMGIGLATSEMTSNLAQDMLYAKQRNKEALMKASPSTNYQTGYGLDFLMRSVTNGGAKIRIETPCNTTQTDFDNYIKYRGWPCDKYATLNLSEGFLQGILYSVPVSGADPKGNGVNMDALRKEISNGVRIVTSGG